MWISQADQQILATWIEHCPALKLVSGVNGEIFWANRAFREFTEYTLKELQAIGWRKLSVDGESLDADIDALKQMQSGYIQDYTVNKQYRTKSGAAKWGILTVLRYPAAGDIQCFLCTFEPLKNGTATAFDLAMERISEMTSQISGLKGEVTKLATLDPDTTWVDSTFKLIKRHPKLAGGFLALALSVFGLNNVVELLQRVGLVEIPVKTPVPVQPVGVGEVPQANLIDSSDRYRWVITTPDGNMITSPERSTSGDMQWLAKSKRQTWQTHD